MSVVSWHLLGFVCVAASRDALCACPAVGCLKPGLRARPPAGLPPLGPPEPAASPHALKGVCRAIWRVLPGCYTYNLAARGCKRLTTKEHQLPQSCCCRRAFTRDHPLSGFPAGQPPYLHGPVPPRPVPTGGLPVQEVMVPFAFNTNLLIGSAPRTLPIRFSMTTTMLFFVIASLLASDPIISAPGAECMAMEAADGDNHAGPGRTWSPGRCLQQHPLRPSLRWP